MSDKKEEYLRALSIIFFQNLPLDLAENVWQKYCHYCQVVENDEMTGMTQMTDDQPTTKVTDKHKKTVKRYKKPSGYYSSDDESSDDEDDYLYSDPKALFISLCHEASWEPIGALGFLLEKGIEIDSRHPEVGSTGLMYAAQAGNLEIVKFLLNQGANPEAINDEGKTAHYFAKKEGHGDIKNLLANYQQIQENRQLKSQCQDLQEKYDHVSHQLDQLHDMMQQMNISVDLPRKQAKKNPNKGGML